MWFFIAEGCHYTRSIQKYASRLFLYCYNGERGSWKGMKWLYYFYYPAHLLLIGGLRLLLHGNISSIF